MLQKLLLNIKGLFTDPNNFSSVPSGALVSATNIDLNKDNIASSRRGNLVYTPVALTTPRKLFSYNGTIFAHDGTTIKRDDGTGTFASLTGTFTVPGTDRSTQSTLANKNIYMTFAEGITKIDSLVSDPRPAGTRPMYDLNAVLALAGSGFLPAGDSVAYRGVFGQKDANGNLILSAPTSRAVVTAGGTSDNVDVVFAVPREATTDYFYQVYRSKSVTGTPSDELQLCYEKAIEPADITNAVVTFRDVLTDDELGVVLYTNPTQQGILQSNNVPPFGLDIETFRGYTFVANTKQTQRTLLKLNANFTIGETITIDGVVFTAFGGTNIAAGQFTVGATIESSLGQLLTVINRYLTNTSTYASKVDPTTILVEKRVIDSPSFIIDASNTAIYATALPITSDNEAIQNRVYISKFQQPESYPILQYLDIGSANRAIKRIVAVRDALFVLKEDGIYRLTGTNPNNFIVDEHDANFEIIGPENAVGFLNQVFCTSDKGIIAISLSGVSVISTPIDDVILPAISLEAFERLSFAIGYNADQKYLLNIPLNTIDTSSIITYVLNTRTGAWSTYDLALTHGIQHNADRKLYQIRASDKNVLKERKDRTLSDFVDDSFDVNVVSQSGLVITLDSVANAVVGQTLAQGTVKSKITAVDIGLTTVTITDEFTYLAVASTLNKPIPLTLQWVREDVQSPAELKHFSRLQLLFQDVDFNNVDVAFSSSTDIQFNVTTLSSQSTNTWGSFTWGVTPWGGKPGGPQRLATFVPRQAAKAYWLNIKVTLETAFTDFNLAGVNVDYTVISTKGK